MLYKALNSDFRSQVDDYLGRASEPWVVGEWKEKSPIWWDISGVGKRLGKGPHSGFFCDADILFAMSPEFTRYIGEVEGDGGSIVHGKGQMWERMRFTSLKAWPASKAALVMDWCENRANDYWESHFPTEATLYNAVRYQGQHAQMVSITGPLWRSLFTNGETIPAYSLHRTQGVHKLKPEYLPALERTIWLAYYTSLALNGNLAPYGGNLAQFAEDVRPGSWETVRGFTEDEWAGLEGL